MSVMDPPVLLRHNKVDLAFHRLREGEGQALLLLHGLGEHTPVAAPPWVDGWAGPVWGLDFTGHGASSVPVGGGYTCEGLMADGDQALAHLGEATILGRGLGAYIGLMLSGARAEAVRGVVLADGHGIAGGGTQPGTSSIDTAAPSAHAPDPYALVELADDIRPRSYATSYARLAVQSSGLDTPITVVARYRPPWLEAVAEEPGVRTRSSVEAALRDYGP